MAGFLLSGVLMDHAPTKEDLSKITLAIQAYPQNAISGAKLGTLIRTAAPGLDFRQAVGVLVGPGAFTKFVDQFLSGVLNRSRNRGLLRWANTASCSDLARPRAGRSRAGAGPGGGARLR